MTRNTKLYQISYNGIKIVYRDLTAKEVGFVENIKTETLRYEIAAKLVISEPTDTTGIPIGIMLQIGSNAYINSSKYIRDKDLFEITVKESRDGLEKETSSPMALIAEIIKSIPGQSITDLFELTYKDLIELVCVCEKIRGVQLLSVVDGLQKKKGIRLVDPKNLPDEGKSLQQKMDDLNNFIGN